MSAGQPWRSIRSSKDAAMPRTVEYRFRFRRHLPKPRRASASKQRQHLRDDQVPFAFRSTAHTALASTQWRWPEQRTPKRTQPRTAQPHTTSLRRASCATLPFGRFLCGPNGEPQNTTTCGDSCDTRDTCHNWWPALPLAPPNSTQNATSGVSAHKLWGRTPLVVFCASAVG
jgi:hypothetical protein